MKSNGFIISINWFIDIVNKISDINFTNICYKAFSNLFIISQERYLSFDAEVTSELVKHKKDIEFSSDRGNAIKYN